jgi:hypothetical protein
MSFRRKKPDIIVKAALLVLALVVAASAQAQGPIDTQSTKHHRRDHREAEPPAPAVPVDKRDSVVAAPGAFSGRPYWFALAQCGGIYFKLNALYTDAAVRARVVKPDPKANTELTRQLNEAIKTATSYFDGAEHFLMTDRGLERSDAVLAYEGFARAAGDRVKTIEAALAAVNSCPTLYEACQAAFPKQCSEQLGPTG